MQKAFQNRFKNASKIDPKTYPKPIQKPIIFRPPKILVLRVYIYIYIAFWSNPPASDKVEPLRNPFPKPLPYKGYRTIQKRPSLGKRFPSSASLDSEKILVQSLPQTPTL